MGVVCVGCQMTTPNGFPWPIQPAAQPAPAPNKNRTVVALKNHERLRVLASTNIIVQFLKVFFKLKGESTSWMKNAGKRYCLFLQLSQENPNTVLIPTADILFVQLCHITRAKKYFQDIPDIIIPYNIFAPQPNFLQNAFKTVKLWEEKFNEPYIRMSQRDIPTIARPPFLACFGPTVQETFAGLSISLTVEQLKNDTAWFATLSGEMLKFSNHYGLSEYDSLVKLTYFYDDFLKLAKNHKNCLAPPIVIDVVWCAHQAAPKSYKSDCIKILGFELVRNAGNPRHRSEFLSKWSEAGFPDISFLSNSLTVPGPFVPVVEGGFVSNDNTGLCLHINTWCDGCRMSPIYGPRYKCGSCDDFDLCAICYKGRKHPEDHCFLIIEKPTANLVPKLFSPKSLYGN